jgi:hypothetical protein
MKANDLRRGWVSDSITVHPGDTTSYIGDTLLSSKDFIITAGASCISDNKDGISYTVNKGKWSTRRLVKYTSGSEQFTGSVVRDDTLGGFNSETLDPTTIIFFRTNDPALTGPVRIEFVTSFNAGVSAGVRYTLSIHGVLSDGTIVSYSAGDIIIKSITSNNSVDGVISFNEIPDDFSLRLVKLEGNSDTTNSNWQAQRLNISYGKSETPIYTLERVLMQGDLKGTLTLTNVLANEELTDDEFIYLTFTNASMSVKQFYVASYVMPDLLMRAKY